MLYRKRYMIYFIFTLLISIVIIAYEVLLVAFPDTLFFESETVNTYNLTSRNKQLTIAGRTYNLDEDISATVTETIYRYAVKGSSSTSDNNIYMSTIQYLSSDGTKKELVSIIEDKEDIMNRELTPFFTINTLLMIICIVIEAIFWGTHRIESNPDIKIKLIRSSYIR